MNTEAVIQLADRLLFQYREKKLNDLEKAILVGTLKNCNYDDIAEKTSYTPSYIGNVAAKLWSQFSDILGKEIKKRNFGSEMEKIEFNSFKSATLKGDVATFQGDVTVNNFNICSDVKENSKNQPSSQVAANQSNIDLGNAPEDFHCYGRTEELKELQNRILEERDRIITILGLPGIGKTILTLQLVEQIKHHFDYVIYRSLRFKPSLSTLLNDLVQCLSDEETYKSNLEQQLSQLMRIVRKQNCLLVLDDVDRLFAPEKLAGTYQLKLEKYQLFFEQIAKVSHQSCLLLCSREKPEEIVQWESEKHRVYSLELKGSIETAIVLFQENQLSDRESWNSLIDYWQGHPLQLQEMAILIQEIFSGQVSKFVEHSTPFFGKNLKAKLQQHIEHLSESEKSALAIFKGEKNPRPLWELMSKSNLLNSEFFNAMQSLKRRLCLESKHENKMEVFYLAPLLQHYLGSDLRDEIANNTKV